MSDPVWVDVLTGNAYRLPGSAVKASGGVTTYDTLAYDSPVFLTDAALLTLDKSAEVLWNAEQEAERRQVSETTFSVSEARFYGPFEPDAPYRSSAEIEAAGHRPRIIRTGADGRFDLKALVPPEQYVGEIGNSRDCPKLSGYVVFRVRPPRAMTAVLYEQCDWFWSVYANGEPVALKKGGHHEEWKHRVELPLIEGWNEIVFRTRPGSSGTWWTALRLRDTQKELKIAR